MKKYAILGALGVVILSAGLLVASAQSVPSGSSVISGWAWSSNIGWISFNSNDSGAGGGPYNVYVNPSGTFGGYAWSPNIGWISFNQSDLSGCPSGAAQAQVDTSTSYVTGWVRAIAGIGRTDGWDGCIQLAEGPSGSYFPTGRPVGDAGVTYVPHNPDPGELLGYAWGGEVVGWVLFTPTLDGWKAPTFDGGSNPISASCSALPANPVTAGTSVTFSASPTGAQYSYYWNGDTNPGASQMSITYSSSGAGPTVIVKNATQTSSSISCPNVVVSNTQPLPICSTAPSNAEFCQDSGPGTDSQNVYNHNDPVCLATTNSCQFQCKAGFKLQGGVCVNSTIREK